MSGGTPTRLRFACQQCGVCCATTGEYGFVYVTKAERRQIAAHLVLSTRSFTRRYCTKTDGFFHLIDHPDRKTCIFLEQGKCRIYAVRPLPCATWPIWPENLNGMNWRLENVQRCMGIGRGEPFTREEVNARLLKERQREAAIWSW